MDELANPTSTPPTSVVASTSVNSLELIDSPFFLQLYYFADFVLQETKLSSDVKQTELLIPDCSGEIALQMTEMEEGWGSTPELIRSHEKIAYGPS
ncbi:MAG: hypothetical protein GY696_32295 [Gammaproteobacteria bacterium]|nr:hypothetical protein [Gammaproteobacteria bacterium]